MFKKILAAIDGSEMSHDVFKTALDIAKADKANLLLLHVLSFEEQNSLSIPMPTGLAYFPVTDSDKLIFMEKDGLTNIFFQMACYLRRLKFPRLLKNYS